MPELFTELRFSILRDKIAKLQIPDAVYNWFVDFFDGHEHCTTFGGTRSSMQSITSSSHHMEKTEAGLKGLCIREIMTKYTLYYTKYYTIILRFPISNQ